MPSRRRAAAILGSLMLFAIAAIIVVTQSRATADGDTPTAPAHGMPEHLNAIPFALAQRLQAEFPEVISWEERDWDNGCFDLDYPGGCPLSVSPGPGYRLIVEFDAGLYALRTDASAARYRIEAAPGIEVTPALRWTGDLRTGEALCLDLQVDSEGLGSIAGCGEPATPIDLRNTSVGSIEFLEYALSFGALGSAISTDFGTSDLAIIGDSHFGGTDLQRRSIEEWARFLAIESHAGRSGASFALAIGWHDADAIGCRNIEVQHFGFVSLSNCPGRLDTTRVLGADDLARLYDWIDRHGPFEQRAADDSSFLVTAGRGTLEPPEGQFQHLREWLIALSGLQ